jgi:hypothetical protein
MKVNPYDRTWEQQQDCNFEGIPQLNRSPFNSIYETRASFLEKDSIYEIDTMLELLKYSNTKVLPGFILFQTDS